MPLFSAAWGADLTTDGLPPEKPPITSLQEFRSLPPDARVRPQPFRIECDVTFYDPAWKSRLSSDRTLQTIPSPSFTQIIKARHPADSVPIT